MKYIAYCRKSTDEKDKQVLSIEAQVAELQEFAKRDHLEITEFITEAKTAKSPGREQFAEVLKKIEKNHAQGILSWHPDRLARNSIDGGKIIYLLDTGKLLDLKFPSFWFENTPQGKFMLSIAFGQSKYYVDNLSENVKRGNRQKLRRGEWPSKAPYGYLNNRQTRSIDVDPDVSKIVKKAFVLFSQGGRSFTEIAKIMEKYGITRGNGKPIHVNQVRNMFTNKFYIGILKYAGEYHEASHKTFIPKQLFDQAQRQVDRIERPRHNGHDFAFRGLATCDECGAAITAEQHIKKYKSGNSQTFTYYRCTKKLKPCTQKYIPESDLSDQVRNIVRSCSLHPDWEPVFEKWAEKELTKDRMKSDTISQKLEGDLTETDQKLNRLLDAYLDQVIDPEVYRQKKNELFEEKLKLQEKIAKVNDNGSSWLEPTREVINGAMSCAKIARAKNNCHELAFMTKTVGSNYSLQDGRLSVTLKNGFAALAAVGVAARRPPAAASMSLLVSRLGFEPRTNSLKGYCSTVELPTRNKSSIFPGKPRKYDYYTSN